MEKQERRIVKRKYLVFPLLMIFVLIVLLAFSGTYTNSSGSYDISSIEKGWSVHRGDEIYRDVDLHEYDLGVSRHGQVITITNNIDVTDKKHSLVFISKYMSVSVSVDGEVVYSYGPLYEGHRSFVPKKLHFITPFTSEGEHVLNVTYTLFDDDSVYTLPSIYIGSKHDLIRSFLSYHRLAIFVGAFFMVYACLLVSLGVFLALIRKRFLPVILSAALSMLFGLYTYCNNDIFCIVSDQDILFTMLEFVSLFLIPLVISVILYSTHPEIGNGRQHFIIGINAVIPIVVVFLHFTDFLYMNRFIIPVQFIVLVEIILIFPQLIRGYFVKRDKRERSEDYTGIDAENYFIMGFIMFITCALIEIVILIFLKSRQYLSLSTYTGNISFLTLGMLFFVICLFIYYFLNGTDHISTAIVKSQLEGIAYTDPLTGLMNRGMCNKYVETLSGRYAIVNFDLDRLKYVNDTYGHLEGDRMIKTFAEILSRVFDKADIIGRTGGDEFVAIFKDPEDGLCQNCISELDRKLRIYNDKEDKIRLSVSVGYAYSDETANGEYPDVFHLADVRMYEMKELHHAQ
ncbi:GGDEF domain-containing protein [Butyrivibrio fibrisolvens]|uniref:GGDEF domain-containing protein n=1 Tax=Butyrivibrio fibrisolvens TaxID=831 RepID=UPI000485AAA2|nr:GGDEF domain-containing protein [Butyrivibrio fibrisolvens]